MIGERITRGTGLQLVGQPRTKRVCGSREARQLINCGQLPGIGINALGRLADAMSNVAHGGHGDRRLAKELIGKADKLQHILLNS